MQAIPPTGTVMTPQQAQPTQTAFEKYLAERLQEPTVRAAYEDRSVLERVIDSLVGFRKALGLNQSEVARRMGVGQSTVSGFETEMSDPRLSTLQRYARAVEAHVDVVIDWRADCDWINPAVQSGYVRTSVRPIESRPSPVSEAAVASWGEASRRHREFALQA